MKKVKKLISLLMLAVMIITSLGACGKKETETDTESEQTNITEENTTAQQNEKDTAEVQDVTLKVWGPQEEQELLAKMTESFAAEHPEYNIKFEFGVVAEGDAATELTKDPEAGADVFMFASDQTSKLVEAGLLYPITYNVDEVKSVNPEAAIESASVDGQLYGYPLTPNSWFMYYDKSKYTEEEVLSLDTMMAKDLGEGVKNFSVDIDNGWYLSAFYFAAGCTLFGEDGKDPNTITFNNENGLEVTKYLIDLVSNPKFLEEDQGNIINAFADGTLAAACSGTWNAQSIQEALGENYAATKLPTIRINGQDLQLKNFADFKLIGVNSQTQYPVPAMQLAEYLANEENQKLRFEVRSIAPTNINLANDPEVLKNPAVAALSLQTKYSTVQSSLPQMSNYWTPAQAFGSEIINGTITKDNAKEKLDNFVESVMSSIN